MALVAVVPISISLPLTAISLLVLTLAAYPALPKTLPEQKLTNEKITSTKKLLVYSALFVLCLLTVFRVIPYQMTTILIVTVLLISDRGLLKEIDVMLLITFVCFFVVSENLGRMEVIRAFLQNFLGRNTLLTAIGTSQIISNVPAAVLLSGFTDQWREMLAGVNIGGLGTPIASLASLITLKFYVRHPGAETVKFLGVFTAANIIGLAVLMILPSIIY